jgi:hypothetical protein
VYPKTMNTKLQLACAYMGPVFVFLFFFGLVPLAQFVPPPSPSASATTIGHMYRDDPTRVRLGLLLMTMSTALTIPWGLTIANWTKRAEGRYSLLTYAQIMCIGISSLVGVLTGLVWSVAAFRPEVTSLATTRMLNDFGWFLYLFTWPPFSMWAIVIGIGVLLDKSETPAFPRWVAYMNFWLAFLLIPAGLMLFFKTGPFAFDGLVTFWVPNVAFFGWIIVMTWLVIKAIKAEERRQAAEPLPATSGEEARAPSRPIAQPA